MSEFTKIPESTFRQLQIGAGSLLKRFSPGAGTIPEEDRLGATTGGINFTATPTYSDFGDDIDNCPKNTKELKRMESVEVKLSGTFATMETPLCKMLIGSADVGTSDKTKITPRNDLLPADFVDLWWVGAYGANDGGFVAIHLMNALSSGGLQLQSSDKKKGQFAFEFTAHYSISAQNVVPYEIMISSKDTPTPPEEGGI